MGQVPSISLPEEESLFWLNCPPPPAVSYRIPMLKLLLSAVDEPTVACAALVAFPEKAGPAGCLGYIFTQKLSVMRH
jgi:hypothetical protein